MDRCGGLSFFRTFLNGPGTSSDEKVFSPVALLKRSGFVITIVKTLNNQWSGSYFVCARLPRKHSIFWRILSSGNRLGNNMEIQLPEIYSRFQNRWSKKLKHLIEESIIWLNQVNYLDDETESLWWSTCITWLKHTNHLAEAHSDFFVFTDAQDFGRLMFLIPLEFYLEIFQQTCTSESGYLKTTSKVWRLSCDTSKFWKACAFMFWSAY